MVTFSTKGRQVLNPNNCNKIQDNTVFLSQLAKLKYLCGYLKTAQRLHTSTPDIMTELTTLFQNFTHENIISDTELSASDSNRRYVRLQGEKTTLIGVEGTSLEENKAFIEMAHHFTRQGWELIDCQVLNPHTASLGAREIPRRQFLQQLSELSQRALAPDCWLPQDLSPHDEDLPVFPKDRE